MKRLVVFVFFLGACGTDDTIGVFIQDGDQEELIVAYDAENLTQNNDHLNFGYLCVGKIMRVDCSYFGGALVFVDSCGNIVGVIPMTQQEFDIICHLKDSLEARIPDIFPGPMETGAR